MNRSNMYFHSLFSVGTLYLKYFILLFLSRKLSKSSLFNMNFEIKQDNIQLKEVSEIVKSYSFKLHRQIIIS
jgi:hypothetical protein